MKTFQFLSLAFVLGGALCFGQTITPNTTLCAAQSATATNVCLTATTGVTDQTGVMVGNEYETVMVSASASVPTGPAYVNVRRGSAGQPPTAHQNGEVAWLALTPAKTLVAGVSGFFWATQFKDVGPCTRSAEVYLPHIWPDLGIKRDCNGVWVPYQDMLTPTNGLPQTLSGSTDAVTVAQGTILVSTAGVDAMTLARPTAGVMDGMVIRLVSTTANAHTLTLPGAYFYSGGTNKTVYTFAAYPGSSITLMAYNGYWVVLTYVSGSFTS